MPQAKLLCTFGASSLKIFENLFWEANEGKFWDALILLTSAISAYSALKISLGRTKYFFNAENAKHAENNFLYVLCGEKISGTRGECEKVKKRKSEKG